MTMSTGALLLDMIFQVSFGLVLTFIMGFVLCTVSLIIGEERGILDLTALGGFLVCLWPEIILLMICFVAVAFIKEVIVELGFWRWLGIQGVFRRRHSLETTPLIIPGGCAVRGYREHASVVGELLAVDVAAVNVTSLGDGARIRSLPTRLVRLPTDDASQIAVLSYRWDFEHDASQDSSPNIVCAIRYAKSGGVQYLFVDIISLDQSLATDALMQQVARFGALYATIQVIAAYDDPRLNFRHVISHPWIFNEIKHTLHNPHKIMYVGYCQQGTWCFRGTRNADCRQPRQTDQ